MQNVNVKAASRSMNSTPFNTRRDISKTAFLLIIFGNRKRWITGIVNGTQNFLGIGRTGRVFHLFRLFHQSATARRARIARTVVIDLDRLWTFIPERNDFCSI